MVSNTGQAEGSSDRVVIPRSAATRDLVFQTLKIPHVLSRPHALKFSKDLSPKLNMIVLINGCFGVRKTSVAEALLSRIPDSMLYDPELLGAMLRKVTDGGRSPAEETGDFQDIMLWPSLVVLMARHLRACYRPNLIVPMTLDNSAYLETIRSGFRDFDPHIYHFCLVAPLDVIEQRLRRRSVSNEAWEMRRARECIDDFHGNQYGELIDASVMSVGAVAEKILDRITFR